jgi:hypothetical protein
MTGLASSRKIAITQQSNNPSSGGGVRLARLFLVAYLVATVPLAGCASFKPAAHDDTPAVSTSLEKPAGTAGTQTPTATLGPPSISDPAQPILPTPDPNAPLPAWVQYDWADQHPICATLGLLGGGVVIGLYYVGAYALYGMGSGHWSH